MGCGNNMKKFVPELEKEASEEQQQDTTLSTLDQVQPQAVQLKSKPKQIDALYQQRLRDFKRISYQNQKLYSSIDTDKKFKVTPSDINRYFISINVMFALSLIQRFLELTGFDSYGPIEFQFLITAIDYFNKYTKFLLIIADNSAVRTPRIKQIIQKGPGTMSMIDQLLDNNTTNLQLLSLSKGLEDKAPEFDDLIKQFSKLHEYQQIQFMNIDINENLYLNIEQIYDFLAQQGYKGKDHDVNIQFYIKCPTYITPQDFQGILSSPNFPIRNQQSLEVIPQIENLQNLIQQFNALSHEEQVLFMEVDTLDEFYVLPIYVYKYFITKLQKDMHLKIKTFFSSLTQIRGDIDGSISNPIGPLEFIQLVIKFNNIINVELKKDSHHQKLDEFIPEFDSQKAKKSNDLVTLLKEFGRLSEQMQEIFEKIDLNEDFLLSPINLFNWMRQNGLEMKLAEYNGFITKQSLNSAGQIRPSEFAQILTKFANMIPNVKLTSQKTAKLQQFADDFSANKSKKSNDFAVLLKEFGALSPMVQTIFETIDDREEFLIAPLSLYNWMKSNGLKMKLGEYNMYIDKKNLNVNNQIRPSEFVEILYTFQKELVKVNLPPLVEESKLNDMALMIGGERMRKSNDLATLLKEFGRLSEQMQEIFEKIDLNEDFLLSPINLFNWMRQNGLEMKLAEYNGFITKQSLNSAGQIRPSEFAQILTKFANMIPNVKLTSQKTAKLQQFADDFSANKSKKSNDFAVLLKEFGALSPMVQTIFETIDDREEFLIAPLSLYNWMKSNGLKMKLGEYNMYIDKKNLNVNNQIRPSEFVEILYTFQKELVKVNLPPLVEESKLNDMALMIGGERMRKSNDLATLLKEFGRLSEQMQEIFEKIDLNEDFLLSPINLFNWMRQNGLEMKLTEYNGFITKQSLNSAGQIRPSEFAQILTKFANMIPNVKLTSQKTAKLQQFADDFSANKSKKSNDFAVLLKEFGALSPMVQTIFETIDDREEFLIAPLSLYNWMKSNGLKMKLGEYNMYIDKKNLNVNNQIRPSEFVEILYTFQKELVKVNLPPLVEESKLNDMALMIGGERMRKSNDLATLLKEFGRLSEQMQEIFEKIDLNEDFLLSPINLFNWMRQNGLEMKLTEYNGFITKQSLNSAGQIRPSEFAQILTKFANMIPNVKLTSQKTAKLQQFADDFSANKSKKSNDFAVLLKEFGALSPMVQTIFETIDDREEFLIAPLSLYNWMKSNGLKMKLGEYNMYIDKKNLNVNNQIRPSEFVEILYTFQKELVKVNLPPLVEESKLNDMALMIGGERMRKSNDLATLLKEFGRLSEQMQEIFEKIDLNEDFLLSPINLFNWMRQNGLEMKLAEYNGFITKQSLNSAGQIRPSEFAQILTKFANMIPNVKLTSQKTAKLQQFADDFSANKSKKSNDFAVLLKEFGALSPMVQTIFETIDDREEFLIAPLSLYNWMKSNGLKMKLGEYNMYIDKKNLNVNNQIRPSEFVEILYTFQKELVKVNLPPLVEESKLNDMALMIGGERMRKSNDLATLLKEFGRLSEQMQEIFEKIDLNEDFLLSPINLFNWMRQNGLEMKLTEYNGFITKQSLNSAGQIRPSEFAQILDQLKVTIPL